MIELRQDLNCPCGCCHDPAIGCVCADRPADGQCGCRYCSGLRSLGGASKTTSPTGLLGVIGAADPDGAPFPQPVSTVDQLRALAEALPPPQPHRVLEVGPGVVEYLRLLGGSRPGWSPRGMMSQLTGVPVVRKDDLEAGAWRLLADGEVIGEGTL